MEIRLSVLRISYVQTGKPDEYSRQNSATFKAVVTRVPSSYGQQNELSLQQHLNDI